MLAKKKYAQVIDYYRQSGYDPRLDPIWANNANDIMKIMRSSNTDKDLIDMVDQTFMYAINFPPENGENTGAWIRDGDTPQIREKCVDWLLHKLKYDLFSEPDYVQESPFIHERNKVKRSGRILSGNFLRAYTIAKRIHEYMKPQTALELGAGAGHQARIMKLLEPRVKYTIVDLPETLIFSFTHLKLCFPDSNFLFVSKPDDMKLLDDDYDFVFIPAAFASMLAGRSYDLFLNTASMGEMRNDVIHFWMDLIQNKVTVQWLFTLNRFLNTVHSTDSKNFRLHCNECSTSYDDQWNIISWEIEPLYCRCPYIDTLHSRYLEIVANRPSVMTAKERLDHSLQLFQDAKDEDWYRLKGYYDDGVGTARDNLLVNDTTMSGTLFKLWEAIRLHRTPDKIAVMLEYLERITVKQPFEEVFYYRKHIKN